jgi:hypothetical protein
VSVCCGIVVVRIKVLASFVVVSKIVDAGWIEVSRIMLVSIKALAPCVVVTKIVDACKVVVCCGSMLVIIKVLASFGVVNKTVEAGKVLPGAVDTIVSVAVAPAWVKVAPIKVSVIVPAGKVVVIA